MLDVFLKKVSYWISQCSELTKVTTRIHITPRLKTYRFFCSCCIRPFRIYSFANGLTFKPTKYWLSFSNFRRYFCYHLDFYSCIFPNHHFCRYFIRSYSWSSKSEAYVNCRYTNRLFTLCVKKCCTAALCFF